MRRPHSMFSLVVAATLVGVVALAAPARTVTAASAPASADAAIAARLDSIAQAATGAGFSGVVVVHRGGREILSRGYGLANRAMGVRFTPRTVVPIGSNVKDFTKLATFALVEAGKLRLSDSLAAFFPDVPSDKRGITVDQLLEHRSGLPLGVAADDQGLNRDEFLARLWAAPLGAAPDAEERYSNAGFSLLAAIIETVSGESFDDHVARTILAPLGLAETGLLRPGFDPSRIAHGYAQGQDVGTMLDRPHDATGHLWSLRGNGGYLATAADQLAFFRAVGAGRLLADPAHRARVFDPRMAGVFAGSDLVSAFLYANFPREGWEVVLASNDAAFLAVRLLEEMGPALGVPTRRRTAPDSAPSAAVELPTGGAWSTVRAWVDAFRAGDEAGMQRFFETRAVNGPDAPPMERRMQNYRRMRGNLGGFTIIGARDTPEGPEIDVRAENGERARVGFDVEPGGLLRGLRIEVG